MSRRSGPSDVRGPTSALTSFLRDKNIRVQNANRFRRREEGDAPVEAGAASASATVEESSHAMPPPPPHDSATPAQRPRASAARRAAASSMQFEEDDASEEEEPPLQAATSSKRGGAAEASSKGKRARFDGEGANVGEASTAAAPVRRNSSYKNTAAGSIDFCAGCATRFTVTTYTKHTPDGGLCHKCSKLGISGAGSHSALGEEDFDLSAVKKKAAPRRRRFNRPMHEFNALPTLQALCINIVANSIEDVEALMGIGGQNMESISKSISKNRRLNPQTVQLFLQPQAKKLAFYDCSQLDSDALASITTFSPHVEEINLQLCGMLDNAAIDQWTKKLTRLSKLELYGCFLVRKEAWHRFFEAVQGRLTSFKIRESPRFDKGCCEKLLACCPNVTELGMAQIGPLDASCLKVLEGYGHQLTYLDVSDPGVSAPGIPPKSLEDDEVISLLTKTGRRLTHLNLSRNADLTFRTLLEGILENCKSLDTLLLALCGSDGVQPNHLVELFKGLQQRGCASLTKISLERCLAVDDDVIQALIEFSGKTLVDINVNSCDAITERGLQLIANGCACLERLDVGFCRAVTDAFVIDLVNNIRPLKEVWLFSCNKISDYLASDRVKIIGKEKYVSL